MCILQQQRKLFYQTRGVTLRHLPERFSQTRTEIQVTIWDSKTRRRAIFWYVENINLESQMHRRVTLFFLRWGMSVKPSVARHVALWLFSIRAGRAWVHSFSDSSPTSHQFKRRIFPRSMILNATDLFRRLRSLTRMCVDALRTFAWAAQYPLYI